MDREQLLQRKALLERKAELLKIKSQMVQNQPVNTHPQQQNKPNFIEDISNFVPGVASIKGGIALAKGYGNVRGGVQESVGQMVPDKPMTTYDPPMVTMPNDIVTKLPIQVGRNVIQGKSPLDFQEGDYLKPRETSTRQATKDLTGLAFDQAVTLGAVKGVPLAVKGADKNLTSILRRIAGQSSSDIKLGRELMAEGGTGAVLSKTKANPAYLGREISPKATELASSRVNEMNPNAMREIGIGSEDGIKEIDGVPFLIVFKM